MSVEELKTRIEELEQELAPLIRYKNVYMVQYYNKKHIQSMIRFELTDEQYLDLISELNSRDVWSSIEEMAEEQINEVLQEMEITDEDGDKIEEVEEESDSEDEEESESDSESEEEPKEEPKEKCAGCGYDIEDGELYEDECCRCEKHYHKSCVTGGTIIWADDGQYYCYDCDSARGATDDEEEEETIDAKYMKMTIKQLREICNENDICYDEHDDKERLILEILEKEEEEESEEELCAIYGCNESNEIECECKLKVCKGCYIKHDNMDMCKNCVREYENFKEEQPFIRTRLSKIVNSGRLYTHFLTAFVKTVRQSECDNMNFLIVYDTNTDNVREMKMAIVKKEMTDEEFKVFLVELIKPVENQKLDSIITFRALTEKEIQEIELDIQNEDENGNIINNSSDDDSDDEQYEQECAQCPTILGQDVAIFCMSNQFTDEEETVCSDCRCYTKWGFGWIDDTEEEIDITDLSIFKVKELKVICKSKGIKGYSKLRKQQLLDLLEGPKEDEEDFDDVLQRIAKYCIDNKLYRQGNDFHNFCDHPDLKIKDIDGGYMFLDEASDLCDDDLFCGMIRIYKDSCNPKWSFWIKKDDPDNIEIDYC